MPPTFELSKDLPPEAEAVGVPVAAGAATDSGLDAAFLAAQGFEGRLDQVAVLAGADGGPTVIAVGVGPADEITPATLRRAGANLARAAGKRTVIASRLLDAVEPPARPKGAQAVAEGVVLAGYRFSRYKSAPEPAPLERFVVVGGGGRRVTDALGLGARIGEGVVFARDLVNEPGGSLTPRVLAEVAVEVAEREDLQVSILDEDDIADAGLGGLLGVNRGSQQPPRFIELCYEPDRPRGTLALVGKGITFDSGGLSIKTVDGMMTMKDDMGGAAALLGAFSVIRDVGPRCRVRAYIPATDNMSGGDATRPGDVLRMRDRTTVEVLNTDAEGRLVLADALALASEAEPDAILDLATLTGAVEVALGSRIAGLLGNHPAWVEQVLAAADRSGERAWPLPLPADYRRRLDSDVADLRNVSRTRDGGTITAGLFLQEFVAEGIPWAHLDIAGTAWWGDADEGEFARGGTGYGVRLILELARTFTRPR